MISFSVSTFFIPSFGRSGTQWLTQTLSMCKGTAVFHGCIHDGIAAQKKLSQNVNPDEYFKVVRKNLIDRQIKASNCLVYGEVDEELLVLF